MNPLRVSSELHHLRRVRRWVSRVGRGAGLSRAQISDLRIAVGEAFTNSVRHGYGYRPSGTVVVSAATEGEELVIRVRDQGRACSVDLASEPDFSIPREGGYGIYLMKLLSDRLEIRSHASYGTEVVLRKKISRRGPDSGGGCAGDRGGEGSRRGGDSRAGRVYTKEASHEK